MPHDITVVVVMHDGDKEGVVDVTTSDGEGHSKVMTFTDEIRVMKIYTLMDMLIDILEGANV